MSTEDYLSNVPIRFNSDDPPLTALEQKLKVFGIAPILKELETQEELKKEFLVAMGRRDDFAQFATQLYGNFGGIRDGSIDEKLIKHFRFENLKEAKEFADRYKTVSESDVFRRHKDIFVEHHFDSTYDATITSLTKAYNLSKVQIEEMIGIEKINSTVKDTLESDIDKSLFYRLCLDHLYPKNPDREIKFSRLMIHSTTEYLGREIGSIYGIMNTEIDRKLPFLFKPNVPPSIEFIRLHVFK